MAASLATGLTVLKGHANHTFTNASVVVKSTCIIITVGYFLHFFPTLFGYLTVTPGYLIPPSFRIWTLFTSGILEASIFNVIVDVLVLIACGQQIEPLWGALEFLKFLAILNVGTAVITSMDVLVAYTATKSINIWFASFNGLAGVLGGVSVAFMQILPDLKVPIKGVEVRLQSLPMFCVMLSIILWVIRLIPNMQVLMVANGICIGWVYLRFYQPHGKGIRGDMNETFEFASLFPSPVRPVIRVMATITFNISLRFGICKSPVRTYDVGAPSSITISLPGSDPSDAERRRKKALRALNERLNKQKKLSTNDDNDEWPTIEDEIDKINANGSVTVNIDNVESNDKSISDNTVSTGEKNESFVEV